MQTIKVRRGVEGNKELAAVGAGPGVGHGQQAGAVKLQPQHKFIREGVARSARACARGVAALRHEALEHTVEGGVVVVAFFRQEDKVVDGNRRAVGKELHADLALVGGQRGVIVLGGVNQHLGRGCVHAVARGGLHVTGACAGCERCGRGFLNGYGGGCGISGRGRGSRCGGGFILAAARRQCHQRGQQGDANQGAKPLGVMHYRIPFIRQRLTLGLLQLRPLLRTFYGDYVM